MRFFIFIVLVASLSIAVVRANECPSGLKRDELLGQFVRQKLIDRYAAFVEKENLDRATIKTYIERLEREPKFAESELRAAFMVGGGEIGNTQPTK